MPLSNAQLQERIEAIENTLNEIQTALNNIATKAQLKSLVSIRQSQVEDLLNRVTSLESQIAILQTP